MQKDFLINIIKQKKLQFIIIPFTRDKDSQLKCEVF